MAFKEQYHAQIIKGENDDQVQDLQRHQHDTFMEVGIPDLNLDYVNDLCNRLNIDWKWTEQQIEGQLMSVNQSDSDF